MDKASENAKKEARKREIDQAIQDRILECRSWGGKGEEIIRYLMQREAREAAEKRNANRLNFTLYNRGGGSWEAILDRSSQAHYRPEEM